MTKWEALELLREKIRPCAVADWRDAIDVAITSLTADAAQEDARNSELVRKRDVLNLLREMLLSATTLAQEDIIIRLLERVTRLNGKRSVKSSSEPDSAEWIGCEGKSEIWCSNCGWAHDFPIPREFCPRCGCRMKDHGGDDDL